jgi:hypothetical protein
MGASLAGNLGLSRLQDWTRARASALMGSGEAELQGEDI